MPTRDRAAIIGPCLATLLQRRPHHTRADPHLAIGYGLFAFDRKDISRLDAFIKRVVISLSDRRMNGQADDSRLVLQLLERQVAD